VLTIIQVMSKILEKETGTLKEVEWSIRKKKYNGILYLKKTGLGFFNPLQCHLTVLNRIFPLHFL